MSSLYEHTVPVKIKYPCVVLNRYKVASMLEKNAQRFLKYGDFFYAPEFLTYRCLLPTTLRASNNLHGESYFAPPTYCKA